MQLAPFLALAVSTSTTSEWTIGFEVGEGFILEKKDVFNLATRVRGQFLYMLEDQDEAEHSFSIRRMRVSWSGYLFSKKMQYKLELALSPRDLAFRDGIPTQSPLLDFYFRFGHLRDLTLQIGQYKVPFNRERVISSGNLNLVDRSITNAEFTLERDIGLDFRSKDFLGLGFLRYYLGVYIGEGRNTFELSDFGLMYIARVEVLPLGLFDDYSMGDLERSESPKLSLAASYAFLDEAKRDRGINGSRVSDGIDFHVVEGDLLFFWQGFSLLGEFFYRDGDLTPSRDGFGFMVQPAYLFPAFDLEIALRFSRIIPHGESSATLSSELGGGINYYFYEHAIKLQADVFHLWRTNDLSNGEDIFRVQLQAGF